MIVWIWYGGRRGFPQGQLPASSVQRERAVIGGFILLLGLIMGSYGFIHMVTVNLLEGLFWLLFNFPAIGLFLWGLALVLKRREITIDRHFVTVQEAGLMGRKRPWEEPLGEYEGVLRRLVHVRSRYKVYTLYLIDLVHPEPDKTINLFRDTSDRGWRRHWESYARLFARPALEESADGPVVRAVPDLDRSLADLMRDGKVLLNRAALTIKPRGLSVRSEDETVVLTQTKSRFSPLSRLAALLVPLALIYLGFFYEQPLETGHYVIGGLGLFLEASFLITILRDLLFHPRLHVGPQGIRLTTRALFCETKGRSIALGEIEGVQIRQGDGYLAPAVLIDSDEERLEFGTRLPKPSLDFVLNTILASVGGQRAA